MTLMIHVYNTRSMVLIIVNNIFKFNKATITVEDSKAREIVNKNYLVIGFKTCYVEPDNEPLRCHNCLKYEYSAKIKGLMKCKNTYNDTYWYHYT